MGFNGIKAAIEDIRLGKMVVVVDDEGDENSGHLVFAAEKVTPENINFMVAHGRGMISVPLVEERFRELNFDMVVAEDIDRTYATNLVSVDHKASTIGNSVIDIVYTIKELANKKSVPEDFTTPGHVVSFLVRNGGVLKRAGHGEAAVDLARLAGVQSAGVICEIMTEHGSKVRVPDLMEFSKKYNIKIITIEG